MLEFELKDFIGHTAREISQILPSRKRCYATISLLALVTQMCEYHRRQADHMLIGGRFPAGASESLSWRASDSTTYDMHA